MYRLQCREPRLHLSVISICTAFSVIYAYDTFPSVLVALATFIPCFSVVFAIDEVSGFITTVSLSQRIVCVCVFACDKTHHDIYQVQINSGLEMICVSLHCCRCLAKIVELFFLYLHFLATMIVDYLFVFVGAVFVALRSEEPDLIS